MQTKQLPCWSGMTDQGMQHQVQKKQELTFSGKRIYEDFLGHFPGLFKAISTYVSITGIGIARY